MLIYHLLLSFTVNDDCEVIKCFDASSNLKTVRQIDGHRDILFPNLVQEYVLNVNGFIHFQVPLNQIPHL